MTSERANLYNALEQAIGREPARFLMERIEESDDAATQLELATLRTEMVNGFAQVDERFQKVDERFDNVDQQLEKIDHRFEKIDDRLFQFHETLRGYSRTSVTTQAASIVGAVGLAVALFKVL